jgi:hypothetical protein
MENWAQRTVRDVDGNRGRATFNARAETLKAFFDILRKRAALEPDARELDEEMGNKRSSANGKPYSAGDDRTSHGLNGHTLGRVTLYCCPHDQVISATTVQGIGWRGMSAEEVEKTGGRGVLTQRVFASGWEVGKDTAQSPGYRYWEDDWRAAVNRQKGFWYPPSPAARFGLLRALRANENPLAALGTLASAPLLYFVALVVKPRINADPPNGWSIPVDAPKLDEPFEPEAVRYGRVSEIVVDGLKSRFNETYDPPSAARNAQKSEAEKRADDPYDTFKAQEPELQAQGTVQSEAAQRYEDHALMRQEARRNEHFGATKGWVNEEGKVVGEDNVAEATSEYKVWRNGQIGKILTNGNKNNPTNHSTILTNPTHAEKALAYDIAIGLCYLSEDDWWTLRIEADWRFGNGLEDSNRVKRYFRYFQTGKYQSLQLHEWAGIDPEAMRPDEIQDQREGELFLNVGDMV